MTLVFLLEERSTKVLLDELLPRILPEGVSFLTIPHEGKSDLQLSIPKKLAAWNVPDTRFVIVQDQDSNDCKELKQELSRLCEPYHKPVLIRIACHEMEAWYFGDLEAVTEAYGKNLTLLAGKRKYREPDLIENPKRELRKLVPQHEQIAGARRIAPFMNPEKNRSTSFQMLLTGIKKLIEEQAE